MIIKNVVRKVRCDMPNCKNIADFKVEKSGFFRSVGLNLCNCCINELYSEIGKIVVPKSPENIFNKKIKVTKEVKGEK